MKINLTSRSFEKSSNGFFEFYRKISRRWLDVVILIDFDISKLTKLT